MRIDIADKTSRAERGQDAYEPQAERLRCGLDSFFAPLRAAYCAGMSKDFDRFRAEFDTLGKHLGNAQARYSEADRRLGSLERDLERATDWEQALEPAEEVTLQELPRAADAA